MIGAPRPLPLAKPAAIDTAQAARYFGARGEPDEKTMALLETCALPLLAAAVLSSASCSDDKEKEPPVRAVNYTIEFSTVSQAVYLGDKYQTGEGNYRLTLTNADGDVLEADLTSVKAPKPSAAMPTP